MLIDESTKMYELLSLVVSILEDLERDGDEADGELLGEAKSLVEEVKSNAYQRNTGEKYWYAYKNLLEFAESKGLDCTCYMPGKGQE